MVATTPAVVVAAAFAAAFVIVSTPVKLYFLANWATKEKKIQFCLILSPLSSDVCYLSSLPLPSLSPLAIIAIIRDILVRGIEIGMILEEDEIKRQKKK